MEKELWMIVASEDYKWIIYEPKKTFPDKMLIFNRDRNWFLTESKEEAIDIVTNNVTDLHETCYDFMIIEKLTVGYLPDELDEDLTIFKWDGSKYVLLNLKDMKELLNNKKKKLKKITNNSLFVEF